MKIRLGKDGCCVKTNHTKTISESLLFRPSLDSILALNPVLKINFQKEKKFQ